MTISHEVLAERLKAKITEQRTSQQAVATAVGIDATALSKILNGKRRVSSLELALLADALNTSVTEILAEGPSAIPTRVAARAQPDSTPAVAAALERVNDYLEIDSLLSEIGISATPTHLPLPAEGDDAFDQGRALAEAVRHIAGQSDSDIDDLASFSEEHLGVDVAVEPLPPGLDGMAISRGHLRLVLISSTIAATRQRYTLAHELGHLAAGDGGDGIMIDENLFGRRTLEERRANSFASSFIMPKSSLQRALGSRGPTEANVGQMLATYKVSIDALAFSLHNAGLVNSVGRDRVRAMSTRKFALLGGNQGEYQRQLQEHGSRRFPSGLLARCLDALDKGEIGVAVLARLISVDADDLLEHLRPLPVVADEPTPNPDRELVL